MAKYTVSLSRKAQKYMDKLTDNIAKPILDALASLGENPRPPGYKKLKGIKGYRIRVGNYRIIYEILDSILLVDVITIGDRKEVYD